MGAAHSLPQALLLSRFPGLTKRWEGREIIVDFLIQLARLLWIGGSEHAEDYGKPMIGSFCISHLLRDKIYLPRVFS